VLTLAHHGPRSHNPAPCLAANGCAEAVEVVGLSHVDLDTLGGCLAVLGRKPETPGFWDLAAFVDVNGPHKLGEADASEEDILRLYAYWAWSQAHRVFPPRDGSVADATDQVMEAAEAVEAILADYEPLLADGSDFRLAEEELNKSSFVEEVDGVVVRVAGAFTNHLYTTPDGKIGRAVVSLRTDFHACTVSFAEAIEGVTCRDIVQSVWTDKDEDGKFLAGGHATIAGGPRGLFCGLEVLLRLRDATLEALAG
jgi:hypothetical protein